MRYFYSNVKIQGFKAINCSKKLNDNAILNHPLNKCPYEKLIIYNMYCRKYRHPMKWYHRE